MKRSDLHKAILLAGGVGLVICLTLFPACEHTAPPAPDSAAPDTTSHAFDWQIETLGDGNSSVLNDVAIIDEYLAIAVGEIHVKDSLGNWEQPYGVAIWDGAGWKLDRLFATGPTGVVSNLRPRGVFAFSETDIWFASGGAFHWDGQTITPYWINDFPGNPSPILEPGQTAEKLWGTSRENLYAVGREGAIAHFDGTRWQKIESGTAVDIQDIWGAVDAETGETTILAVASFVNYGRGLELLQVDGTTVTRLDTTGLRLAQSSVWFEPSTIYYIAGDGLFQKTRLDSLSWKFDTYQPTIYLDRVRGTSWKDVFLVGSFGFVAHYNGSSWKEYTGREIPSFYSRYKGLSVKDNVVVVVGWQDERAVILRGTRN